MTRKTFTAGVATLTFLLLPVPASATFHLFLHRRGERCSRGRWRLRLVGMKRLGVLLAPVVLVTLTAIRGAAQTTFTVTGVCCANYMIDGQPDPTLAVVRGQTYDFNLVNCAIHPFNIQSTQGFGGMRYPNVVNNGGTSGTVTLTVPLDEPASTLYYQCGNHPSMNGVINVVDPPTPTPTLSPPPSPTPTATPSCIGDCNGDEQVTVDEILTMVDIALGNAPLPECEPSDADHDGQITIDEILTAVDDALNGCPT
jgi:FtsP/CotA-like multicopper oxidase with cupredoxin domain